MWNPFKNMAKKTVKVDQEFLLTMAREIEALKAKVEEKKPEPPKEQPPGVLFDPAMFRRRPEKRIKIELKFKNNASLSVQYRHSLGLEFQEELEALLEEFQVKDFHAHYQRDYAGEEN